MINKVCCYLARRCTTTIHESFCLYTGNLIFAKFPTGLFEIMIEKSKRLICYRQKHSIDRSLRIGLCRSRMLTPTFKAVFFTRHARLFFLDVSTWETILFLEIMFSKKVEDIWLLYAGVIGISLFGEDFSVVASIRIIYTCWRGLFLKFLRCKPSL